MVKYNPELKAQIVHEYLSTTQSTNDLSKKYHIGKSQIARWIIFNHTKSASQSLVLCLTIVGHFILTAPSSNLLSLRLLTLLLVGSQCSYHCGF